MESRFPQEAMGQDWNVLNAGFVGKKIALKIALIEQFRTCCIRNLKGVVYDGGERLRYRGC